MLSIKNNSSNVKFYKETNNAFLWFDLEFHIYLHEKMQSFLESETLF